MNSRFCIVITFIALVLSRAPLTFAQAPTEEPTKRPYDFPTPIFVPTFPNDTPPPPPTRAAPIATPSTSSAPDQPSGDQSYTVQPGDSLWIIAQKVYGNGSKYPLIANANGITTTTRLRTGMVLKIPGAPGLVTVTPTSAPATPTLAATRAPVATLVSASATPSPSPTVASLIPASIANYAPTVINIISTLFVLASLAFAVLAYLMYARARRLKRIEEGKPPLRLR
ncbi:MAG: LysM peptidoglycan-binding domain-containing protein [Chloroflexota bacterium]